MKKYAMPLQPISVEKPFSQWGLDVIGPINPKSSKDIYIFSPLQIILLQIILQSGQK
jgi:hypothetical protein